MLLQEKQLSDLSPVHVEFSRFSDGSKLNRSPQCLSPITGRLCKDKHYFWKLHHFELIFFIFCKNSGFSVNTVVPFHSFSDSALFLEYGILEKAWYVSYTGQFIFVFQLYEWFLQHHALEVKMSVWDIIYIASGVHKPASNLGHVYAWCAKVCLKLGACLCMGCISLPQIWGMFMPGVHRSAWNLGHVYAWGAYVCLKSGACLCTGCRSLPETWGMFMHGVHKFAWNLGHVYARCAWISPWSGAHKRNSRMVFHGSGSIYCRVCIL